jgi:HSP20 family protein
MAEQKQKEQQKDQEQKQRTDMEQVRGGELQRGAGTARGLSPFEEMDRMFDDFFSRGMRPLWGDFDRLFEGFLPRRARPVLETRFPRVDVLDRDEDVLVRAELPGVEKKDLDISVTDNTVTIKGSTKHEEEETRGEYYRCEISRGAFARTVSLPAEVDSDKCKAQFKEGILELTMPKIERSKRRTIKVE